MAIDLHDEMLDAVEADILRLMAQHKQRRKSWQFHEFIPWEQGRNFREEPWEESQCTIPPIARTALVLNLLTEDNLPYYHETIGRFMPEDSAYRRWNRLWTAEEGQHAIAMRSYLLTTRNCDPSELEASRMATMSGGYASDWANPVEAAAYTSAQELATRISHRNAGSLSDDPIAFRLMKLIATDENHHFIFYRGLVSAFLREEPSTTLAAIHKALASFQMPGLTIPKFRRRAIELAKAGVYNLRIHHDSVLQPLLREWKLGDLVDLTPEGARLQEAIMALPDEVVRAAEVFEARVARGAGVGG